MEAEGQRTEMNRKTAQEAAHWYGGSESMWRQMKGGREMCEGQKFEVVPPYEFSIYQTKDIALPLPLYHVLHCICAHGDIRMMDSDYR